MTHRRPRTWLSEAVIIVVLVLLPMLFWWRLWALDPADRAVIPEGDFTEQYYPLRLYAARELAAGRLPAWDPYINAGQPGLADIQTGFFYPLNLLPGLFLALVGRSYGLELQTASVIVHFALASLFTYLFVRHLARRAGSRLAAARLAGVVAALSFTYGGYLTSFPVQQLTILETAVWLPLVLFFLDRAFFRPKPLPQLILAGMALACALLAGHPQTAMYAVYATVAYGLFMVWATGGSRQASRFTVCLSRAAYFVLIPVAVALVLTAVQLVPTLGFITRSSRAGLNYDAVSWGFPLTEVTHLLYPGFFGGSPQYVGIMTLILAVAAWFVKRARREVVFWTVVGVVAFLLAFGGNTSLYNLTYLLVPGFGAVRNQERIIYLFSFALSVLAGYGALTLVQPLPLDERRGYCRFGRVLAWVWVAFLALTALFYFGYLQGLQQDVEINLFEGLLRHHVPLLLILGGAVLLFALRRSGHARRGFLMALTLGLIWLNLFTVNWRYNLAEPIAGGPFPETDLVAFLNEQPGPFRLSSAGLLPGGASAGIVYQLEDITGNTPLSLAAFGQFEEEVGSWRRWQLLAVRYVLSQRDLEGSGLERVFEEEDVKVYRVQPGATGDPWPRAWMVHSAIVAEDDRALEILDADDFDPQRTAILPPEHGELAMPGASAPGAGAPGAGAQIVETRPGRLVLDVSPTEYGLLVVGQPFYPGWRARVDAELTPIHRVDFLLQGIPLGAGSHRVELSFHLSPLPAIVSLVALLACTVALVLSWRSSARESAA